MFSGAKQLFSGEYYTQSSVQEETIGALGTDKYGDLYRYIKVGGSNISAGKLQLAPAPKTNHHNCAAFAAVTANGKIKEVQITLGATAAVVSEYVDGQLIVNDNGAEGVSFRITKQPAIGSASTGTITVDRPFLENIAVTDEFTFVHNTWRGVVEGTTVTQRAAGVPLIDMTASYFGWVKTRGVTAVLIGSAATLGADVIVGGTAGAVTDRTDALGASAEPVVGVADISLGVATEYSPIRLKID